MRAILIDDEPLAAQSLERMLARSGVEVSASYHDPAEAVAAMERIEADVVFLDIEMPGMNGLEAAERIQTVRPGVQIVFVTAYDQYAVDAFELEAIDYLLKPVQLRRLDKTLDRLRARRAVVDASRPAPSPEAMPPGTRRGGTAQTPELCCLQRLSFRTAAGTPVEIPWRTAKAKELFAYLVHVRGAGVSKESLTDMLWPEIGEEKALTNLHTTVYQIRRTLKSLGIPVHIVYHEGVYRLSMEGTALDTERWEAEAAAALAQEPAEPEELKRTLQSYRGDYLEQEGYLWAESERQRLRIQWLECARLAVERLEGADSGTSGEAIGILLQIRTRFPLLDDAYFRLMRLYDSLGQPAEVRAEYTRLTETLREEVDLAPREEIRDWYARWLEAHVGPLNRRKTDRER